MVVLKNSKPELPHILTKLVFKNVGERHTAKNYLLVSLRSVVSNVFEKLLNNKLVDHLEKCGLFLISHMVVGLLNQLQILSQLYLIFSQ